MPERSGHAVNGGPEGRRERPETWQGQPRRVMAHARPQPPYTTAPPRNTISFPGRQAVHASPSVSWREAIT